MIFFASDFTMNQKSPDGNKGQSFVPLPPEPNGRNKSMGAHDRIHPDPANSRHSCTVTFAGGAFWNSPLPLDQEGPALERFSSSHKRNSRPATFIQAELVQNMTVQALFRQHGKANNTRTRSSLDPHRATREWPHQRFTATSMMSPRM
jgi:hypothetical protein